MQRIILALTIMLTVAGSEAFAGRPWDFLIAQPRHHHHHRVVHHGYNYWQARRCLNRRYPKYTGAFHANYFRDIGVPPGDVGLRGNGLYAFPW